jgi:hypothetical protein
MKIQSMILLFAAFVVTAPQAFGYEIYVCGDDLIQWEGTPRIRASAAGFPNGHARSAALQAVVTRLNNSPANFRFNLTWNDGDGDLYNGDNEIWFSGDAAFMDGALALTFPSDDCGDWGFGDGNSEIEEMDVVFACDFAWDCAASFPNAVRWFYGTNSNSLERYGGNQTPFRPVAMHELGHALGLAHENDEYNVMGLATTHIHVYGNTATAYLGEDASLGVVRLYGSTIVPREDVSVVHWRRTGVQGEYSTHGPTRILDANGMELEMDDELDPANIEPGAYLVDAGQQIQVEFSFENNGSTDQVHVPVYYILSRDKLLNFGDIRLAEAHPTLLRNDVYTRTQTIHLPGGLNSRDRYRILAVVDPWSTITDIYNDNNITYSRAIVVR